ncbi:MULTISPECIES: pyridoxamine 5'-phosphate oxidase family protein [Methylobacterium]|uniref:Pyridoxamine 5'-phosphate oxidase family protein n=1 Tax=Methylobacterium longum TaxID=767694 RepID=A0ABT8AN86_9HYPH|nr:MULTISPECIES: pyridoxamine 5'-phosphate oxidase family protein [Methylobacterium]MCJ2103435.1 pyridoxamine 5'-phosphate oxidase family protein [Methylobacterium sp. E-046]MDN3571197.1 pyridoxamine 5'-phosphate oxidase family protein [Methylobacterium longum]GJE09043.1 Pyridoxine/pyridoxamine 5'-phosphate oxidase [Methylobacterium longum]
MSRAPLPPFYDDLDATFAELWRMLADGVAHGRSGFHLPGLATLGADGAPRLRTVVLRAADAAAGALRFHCDRRSDKAAEILAHPACALAAYDDAAKVQIRAEGRAGLHTDDAVADGAWAESRPMSRVCYGSEPAPGTGLAAGGAYAVPDPAVAGTPGRPHFAVVVVAVERLDFLYLDRRGHRRAAWRRSEAGWQGSWLAP